MEKFSLKRKLANRKNIAKKEISKIQRNEIVRCFLSKRLLKAPECSHKRDERDQQFFTGKNRKLLNWAERILYR